MFRLQTYILSFADLPTDVVAHLAVTDGNACVTNYRGSSAVFTEGCFTAGGGDHGGGNPFIQTFNIVEAGAI